MWILSNYCLIVFICFYQDTLCDTDWTEYNGKLYGVLKDVNGNPLKDTWEGAVLQCEKEKSILLSPTGEMDTWVTDFLKNNNLPTVWIGIDDRCRENEWQWSDRSPVNQSEFRWLPGEPNDQYGEDCVQLKSSGEWNDLSCNDYSFQIYIVCQKCKPCDMTEGNTTCRNNTIIDNLNCDENFKLWPECFPDCRPGPADILFVVDTSTSMDSSINQTKWFINYIIHNLPIGPTDFQVALITYNFDATLVFDFTQYTTIESLHLACQQIRGENGVTYTGRALKKTQQVFTDTTTGSRKAAYKYAILITDGLSTDSSDVYDTAEAMRKQGIKVISVGVGQSISHAELSKSAYNEQFIFSYLHYKDAFNKLLQDSIDNGCTDCTSKTETDIIILLDTHKNQFGVDFRLRRKSIRSILENTIKVNTNIRVGLMIFSDHPDFIFNLSWSNNTDKLIAAAFDVEKDSVSVDANIKHALEFIHQSGFSSSNGGRSTSRKLVFVISNGNWVKEDTGQIMKLKNEEIEVLAVAYGSDLSFPSIESILDDPSNVLYIPVTSRLDPYECFNVLPAITSYYECADNIFQLHL